MARQLRLSYITYGDFLIVGGLLGLHGVHRVVDLIVVGWLDAADGDTVVHSCLVNGCRQRLLGELKLRGRDQRHGIILVRFAGVLEQLPDLLGPTRASFYKRTHNNQSSIASGGRNLAAECAAIFNQRTKERLEIRTSKQMLG